MSMFFIRWSVTLIAVYLILCYLVAAIFHVNIWSQVYYLLVEFCICLCISKQGVYHCKYLKWTAYAILVEDTIACLDVIFDFIPDNIMSVVPPTILTMGIAIPLALAIRHYMKARKVMRLLEQWKSTRMPSRQ